MKLSREPFKGPYYGLNTTLEPRDLSPSWATEADNIILAEGRLRVRPPIVPYVVDEDGDNPAFAGEPIGMYHWVSPKVGPILLVKTYNGNTGELYALTDKTVNGEFVGKTQLAINLGNRTPTWVAVHGVVYVMDGGDVIKTDGTPEGTYRAGLPVPTVFFRYQDAPSGEAYLYNGMYAYAVTLYDADHDVESNPVYSGADNTDNRFEHTASPSLNYPVGAIVISGQEQPPNPPGEGQVVVRLADRSWGGNFKPTHWRLYRRDFTYTLPVPPESEWLYPFYLLRSELAIDSTQDMVDPQGLANAHTPPLGSTVTGPFAPAKNGLPPKATVGHYFGDRMFYNDTADGKGDLLRFSAIGKPDHVDPDDYEVIADEKPGITGMASMQGQLVALKPRSIWILSGLIVTHTNETIATGAATPESTHYVYKTKSSVGCANTIGGNGAIVAGHPPLLYFNGETGFFVFDGTDDRMVSDAIKPTWRELVRIDEFRTDLAQEVTYALDPGDEVLFICMTRQAQRYSLPADNAQQIWRRPFILAYHYGRQRPDGPGAFTKIKFDEAPLAQFNGINCVATPLGDFGTGLGASTPSHPAPFFVGTAYLPFTGFVYIADPRQEEAPMPPFRYQTGRIPLHEGLTVHVYDMTWLHDQVDPFRSIELRRTLPAVVRFGVAVRGSNIWDYTDRSLEFSGIKSHVHVGRETSDVSLAITDPPNIDNYWTRQFGVIGWAFHGETAGLG